ncbi:MAG: hypothetical protein JXA44_09435 [Methanospirillaceae archaeon]|nr:hypothetical protein [Methanospirillaceae archaeon]
MADENPSPEKFSCLTRWADRMHGCTILPVSAFSLPFNIYSNLVPDKIPDKTLPVFAVLFSLRISSAH